MIYYNKTHYLAKKTLGFGLGAFIIWLGMAVLVFLDKNHPHIILSYFLLLLIFVLFGLFIGLLKLSDRYDKGWSGEYWVKKKLSRLSDDYVVFRGFCPYNRRDIDFIVIGPTGVFTIEVKNVKYPSNVQVHEYIGQATREALQLAQFLKEHNQQNIYVKKILVFVDLKDRIKLGMQSDVHVMNFEYLNEAIVSGNPFVYQNKNEIVELIKKS